jgi:hypothetical protein
MVGAGAGAAGAGATGAGAAGATGAAGEGAAGAGAAGATQTARASRAASKYLLGAGAKYGLNTAFLCSVRSRSVRSRQVEVIQGKYRNILTFSPWRANTF